MGITAVVVVSSISAGVAAFISARSIKSETVTVRDLWYFAQGALILAVFLSIYFVFWSSAAGGDMRELLLPDFLDNRGGRTMFFAYALASAGFATAVVALLVSLFNRRRKA
jgi:hypothetical protein